MLNKKAILLLLIICLAIIMVVLAKYGFFKLTQTEPPSPRIYIALGDSVSSGYGVASDDRYTDVLFRKLLEESYADEYVNMGINGLTTTTLYAYLNNLNDDGLNLFKDSSVVTINIGGNNILMPFLDFLPSFEEIAEIISAIGEVVSDVREVVSDAGELVFDVREIISDFSAADIFTLTRLLGDAAPVFNDVLAVFGRVTEFDVFNPIPFLFGPFPGELEVQLQAGIDIFAVEFENIVTWLGHNAPDAVLIVNTVYNPIPREIMGFPLLISERADALAEAMNSIIFELAGERGFLVSDVYAAFENEPRLIDIMNFNLDLSALTLNFDIIHPNAAGHELIYELNYNSIIEYKGQKFENK